MPDYIFCQIVAGEAPASLVYQDPVCTAFMDIRPVNPGHLLVVPNAHAAGLSDLPPETGAHLFQTAQRLAAAIRASGLTCEGINLVLADGAVAGQEVAHVHLHVIPRREGDGFGFKFGPSYLIRPGRGELDSAAQSIRSALSAESGDP